MLKNKALVFLASLASATLVASAGLHAATSTVTPPKPPPRRAPLAPPQINDVSRAYEFRTRLLGSPQCQRFATESDNVFLNGQLDDEQKAAKLKAIGTEARASNCLN